jgi:UDP-N-acetylglucosamine--N-acetylmuramyl-(pentapeptide) pyrophosphoryl-undecaprenol N-acetylglucosamine transferase
MEELANAKVVVTGGGSGGHTIPALVMIKYWSKKNIKEIYYLGSEKGIERQVVTPFVSKYFVISTGKLRRYFSLENFLDFFKFFLGIFQSVGVLWMLKPSVVFSTGGFVALPVVMAAKFLGIKVVIHEQTTHVGLANKLSSFFAHAICISFKSSEKYFPASKTFYTGYPLREEFYHTIEKLQSFQGRPLKTDKPVLLILGGGNGSILLNRFVKNNFQYICEQFQVILQAGKSFEAEFETLKHENFWVFSFLQEEMVQLLFLADYVMARAGAGTVCELVHLQKKCLFVPLAIAQKNEQWHNAMEAQESIGSIVVSEEQWHKLPANNVVAMLESLTVKTNRNGQELKANATDLIHSKIFEN